jgi:hypothetical protein
MRTITLEEHFVSKRFIELAGVNLGLHPGLPTESLRREHYDGFGPSVSYALGTAAWGWHAENGLHVLRMVAAPSTTHSARIARDARSSTLCRSAPGTRRKSATSTRSGS